MSDINDLQGLLNQIKQDFIEELPSKIDDIEHLTLKCQDEQEAFQELYRNVHSLKGNGGTLGLPIITSVCHQYESFLNNYADKTIDNDFTTVSLEYIDILKELHHTLLDSNTNNFSHIEEKLAKVHSNDVVKHKMSVLISVASPLEQSILEQTLPDTQFYVAIAKNGMDALEHLMISEYDLVITSLETPVINGLALISAVKKNGGMNKDIKSVLLTSKEIDKDSNDLPSIIIKKDPNLHERLESFLKNL